MTYRNKNYIVTMFIARNIDMLSAQRFLTDNLQMFIFHDEELYKQLVEQKIKWLVNKIVLADEESFADE